MYHGSVCGRKKKSSPCAQLLEANTESQEPRQRQSVRSVSRPLAYRIRHMGEVPQYLIAAVTLQWQGGAAYIHTTQVDPPVDVVLLGGRYLEAYCGRLRVSDCLV